jgi:putative nucleotidyltransferase with HDIG domain
LFIAKFSYENTVVPIIKLQKDTKELMSGNLNHEIAIARKDEIGDLSQTFNLMTLNLKKSWEKLEEYNKNLEEEVKEKTKNLTNANKDLNLDIIKRKKTEKTLSQTLKRNEKLAHELVDMVGRIVETRDPYTAGHQLRVSELATAIAREMKLTEDRIEGIRTASLIHDIGKISIPADILSNPTKLNEIEYGLIKNHSQIGYDILKTIDFPWPVAQIIIQHHENLDGSGYPQGLKGNKILLEAKIMGVADVVEAMSSHRPYRPALGIDKALEEISQNRGILYDPEVVDTCLKLFRKKKFKF